MLCQHPWGGKQLWQPLLQGLTLNLYKKGFRSTISWILKKYWLENALANSKHNHSAFVDLGRLLQNLCMYPVLHSSNFHQTYREIYKKISHEQCIRKWWTLKQSHDTGRLCFLCYYTYTHKLVYFLLCTIPGTCSVNPKIIRHTFFLTSLGTAGIWCYCVGCKKKNCCTLTSSQISGL